MSDEEYEREKADINFQLALLMDMLHRNKVDERYSWTMRKKVKWHRLKEKRKKQVNMQLIEELRKLEQIIDVQLRINKLEAVELQHDKVAGDEQVPFELEDGAVMSEKFLEKIESNDFEINNLWMFTGDVKYDEEDKQHLCFEIVRSHMENHTKLRGGIVF